MSIIVDFSIFPLDKGESLSSYVARSIEIIRESGLPYEFRAMGTSIEAESFDAAMAVVKQCFEAMQRDCGRVSLALKADYRRGPGGRIRKKVDSVLAKIG